jgi:hypothetical protein
VVLSQDRGRLGEFLQLVLDDRVGVPVKRPGVERTPDSIAEY